MSRLIAFLIATLAGYVAVFAFDVPAHASCPAPSLTASPLSGPPGAQVQVHGVNWQRDCADTQVVVGDTTSPAARPAGDRVTLYFAQAALRQRLVTVTADSNYKISATVTVPRAARNGAASIEAIGARSGTKTVSFEVQGRLNGQTQQLPFTGAPAAGEAAAGAVLLSSGVVLLALARRQNRPPVGGGSGAD